MDETADSASRTAHPLTLFVVAGEHSGDHLGGRLMAALNRRTQGRIRYVGVGGEAMAQQGLASRFPISDVAVMGPLAIAKALIVALDRDARITLINQEGCAEAGTRERR